MNFIKNLLFVAFLLSARFLCYIARLYFQLQKNLKIRSKKGRKKKILIFAHFFPENAGFHYRVRKWKDLLEKANFEVNVGQLFNEENFKKLSSRDNLRLFIIVSFFKRFKQVLLSGNSDIVIVRRKLLPYNDYGDLFLDNLLLVIHPFAILDFDDDLTNNKTEEATRNLFSRISSENTLSFYTSLRLYKKMIAGSRHLKELAMKQNPNLKEEDIIVLPTCVDYNEFKSKEYNENTESIVFGWIGSDNNQFYLDMIVEDLNKLSLRYDFKLLVISGKKYSPENALFKIENRTWSLKSEKDDLYDIDIGLMPLEDNKRCRSKCGFKIVQYMGLGIVPIADAIGANMEIIDDGKNGFLVRQQTDWYAKIEEVISLRSQFSVISSNAREKIKKHYSFSGQFEILLKFLNNTVTND